MKKINCLFITALLLFFSSAEASFVNCSTAGQPCFTSYSPGVPYLSGRWYQQSRAPASMTTNGVAALVDDTTYFSLMEISSSVTISQIAVRASTANPGVSSNCKAGIFSYRADAAGPGIVLATAHIPQPAVGTSLTVTFTLDTPLVVTEPILAFGAIICSSTTDPAFSYVASSTTQGGLSGGATAQTAINGGATCYTSTIYTYSNGFTSNNPTVSEVTCSTSGNPVFAFKPL